MERESEPDKTVHPGTEAAAQADRLNPASAHSKRLKELQNAALQTTLMAARMEAANLSDAADTTTTGGEEEEEAGSLSERHAGEGEQSNGLPFRSQSAPRGDDPPLPPPPANNQDQRDPADGEEDEEKTDSNVRKEASEQERTLTDHLNKRLLSSFLEKLNERDLQALPGVQRLDCAVAAGEEDSNRAAADDW